MPLYPHFAPVLDCDVLVLPMPYFEARREKIQAIMLHCLGYMSPLTCLSQLFLGKVSAHYLLLQLSLQTFKKYVENPRSPKEIDAFTSHKEASLWWHRSKTIILETPCRYPDRPLLIQLVHPYYRAWHAGVSSFGQLSPQKSLNCTTIGIELHSPDYHDYHTGLYTQNQVETLALLLKSLCQTHTLDPRHIITHTAASPNRRTDPAGFPWDMLIQRGLGYKPHEGDPLPALTAQQRIHIAQRGLYAIGFSCPRSGVWCLKSQQCLNAYRFLADPNGPIIPVALEVNIDYKTAAPDEKSITDTILKKLIFQSTDPNYPPLLRGRHVPFPAPLACLLQDDFWHF